jgi:hypothetical protein
MPENVSANGRHPVWENLHGSGPRGSPGVPGRFLGFPDTDSIFTSNKTGGKSPRVGNMLAADYLRPAAVKARALTITHEHGFDKQGNETDELRYWDKQEIKYTGLDFTIFVIL